MKHFYFITALLFTTSGLNAQRNADLSSTITSPVSGTILAPMQTFNFEISVLNEGPDAILPADTLAMEIFMDGFQLTFAPGDLPYIAITEASVPVGSTYNISRQFSFSPTFDGNYVDVCISVYPMNALNPIVDPVSSNDSSCISVFVTSTASLAENEIFFQLYPNPASDFIQINSDLKLTAIEVRNAEGKMCLSGDPVSGKVNTSELPAGIYFVTVKSESSSAIRKLIVE